MNVNDIDFGSEDARNLKLKRDGQKSIFLNSYIVPAKFKLQDFYDGNKYFVYGGKGAGKTALLQYIRLKAEKDLSAHSSFFYFQSSFSNGDLQAFLKNAIESPSAGEGGESIINDSNFSNLEEISVFWRLFLLLEVSDLLRRHGFGEGPAGDFIKLAETSRLISQARNVGKKFPNLQAFSLNISKNPSLNIEGTFEDATPSDLTAYLGACEEKLEDVYLENFPIFIFIDEMEVYLKENEGDRLRLLAVASLVRAVRDFNERFSDSHIRVVAAIRDAVITEVSVVQDEVYRIILDNGVALDWPAATGKDLHPLEQMVLSRIVVQDADLGSSERIPSIEDMKTARGRYFPGSGTLRKCLNLTWYRPRDISLLFEEASSIDKGLQSFRTKTLTDGVLKPIGIRMWRDVMSGLSVKYGPREVMGIDKIIRGGKPTYRRDEFLSRLEELSHIYDEVALLSDTRWMEVVEDLYGVGAIYSKSKMGGHLSFSFRGDPMPSLTEDFHIGIHQSLIKALSIQSK